MPKILSPDQIEGFRRDGYVSRVRVISTERAAAIRQRIEDFERSSGGPLTGANSKRAHLLFTCLNELVREERIVDAIEDLYGENLLAWSTDLFIKEPSDPAFVSWHQDSTYWGLTKPDVVTAWVALSESNKANGALEVIPGTHLKDQLPHQDTFSKGNMLSRGQEVAVEVDPRSSVMFELEPGEMSLHHVRLVHGSAPNRSKTQRRIGFAIRYIPTYVHQIAPDSALSMAAALVRGVDTFGSFEHEPIPTRDMDPKCIAFHKKYVKL